MSVFVFKVCFNFTLNLDLVLSHLSDYQCVLVNGNCIYCNVCESGIELFIIPGRLIQSLI